LKVTLFERRSNTGLESSWAGGGILSPLYPWRYSAPLNRLARWGQEYYPRLADELRQATGIDPEWRESGLLMTDAAELAGAAAWADAGNAVVELVQGDAIEALQPGLSPGIGQAAWMPRVAQVRNPRLVRALRADIGLRGAVVSEDRQVIRLLAEHGRIRGVETDKGPLHGDCVIVAAGAWTSSLLEPFGAVPDIRPVKGQMLLFGPLPGLLSRIVLKGGHYLIPRADGHILAGSTLEHTGFDKAVTQSARDSLALAAAAMLPGLDGLPIERQWAGLRPGSSRELPWIGRHPAVEGLYVNSGHYRNGLVLGPGSARLLADRVLGRKPIQDLWPFSVELIHSPDFV